MPLKTNPYSRLGIPGALLAVALIMLPAGESAAHPGSGKNAGQRARPATRPAATRPQPVRQNGERAVPERPVTTSVAGKRDPFEVPPPPQAEGGGGNPDGRLPPGVRGLVIGTLRLEGIVRDEESGAMIAVVTNHSNLAYFLHLHEEVYDGVVSGITTDAIDFQQKPADSGGRLEPREVVLRLGSGPQEAR